jgi:glycerophosphodiester phosphodiesterase
MAENRYLERCGDQLGTKYKPRSHSLDVYEQSRAKSLVERMKHTFEFKLNGSKGFNSYKGNMRSECIRAPFVTLEELFVKLPESVRFDIEISEFSPLQHLKKERLRRLTFLLLRISHAL